MSGYNRLTTFRFQMLLHWLWNVLIHMQMFFTSAIEALFSLRAFGYIISKGGT